MEFSLLDPRGNQPVQHTIPLSAPRLHSLEGKTIYVYTCEAVPLLMPRIAELLPRFVAGVKVVVWDSSVGGRHGKAIIDGKLVPEIAANADACVAGHCE